MKAQPWEVTISLHIVKDLLLSCPTVQISGGTCLSKLYTLNSSEKIDHLGFRGGLQSLQRTVRLVRQYKYPGAGVRENCTPQILLKKLINLVSEGFRRVFIELFTFPGTAELFLLTL